MVLTTSENVLK